MIKNSSICIVSIIFLALCANASETLNEKIPYCHSKNDYNCQVKINDVKSWYETFGDLSNSYWYQIKEQRWKNINGEYKLIDNVTLIQLPQQIESKKELSEI